MNNWTNPQGRSKRTVANRPSWRSRTAHTRRSRWAAMAVTTLLAVLWLGVAGADIPQPLINQPAHRLHRAIDRLDNQLATLLEAVPPQANGQFTSTDVRISYLIVIRHFYKAARHTRNADLKASLTLRADELAAAAPAYQAIVKRVFAANAAGSAPPTPAMIAGYAALRRFENLGKAFSARLHSKAALHHYVRQVLSPLLPLLAIDAPAPTPAQVWPPIPAAGQEATPVGPAREIPIAQTLLNIQRANLLPQVRRVLRQIVHQMQTGSPAHLIAADEGYYRLMLGTLALAENLQASAALGTATQVRLNHELLVGLLLFKDPRTRAAATRRLTRLAFIAGALNTLEDAALPPRTKVVIGLRMHSAIRQLAHQRTARTGVAHLQALEQMIQSYSAFAIVAANAPAGPQQQAWQRCQEAAAKIIQRTTLMLMDGYSNSAVQDATSRLATITKNLRLLLAMAAVQSQALIYRPVPINGVQRNIVRWTRDIGSQPDAMTRGARDFQRMQSSLAVLAHIRLAMPHHAPDKIIQRLSGGKYDQFIKLFLATQRELINSLAQRHISPGGYVATLQRELLVFRCTRDLALLETRAKPLHRLNGWGAWFIASTPREMLNRELQEALEMQYIVATGGSPRGDNWLTFDQAAPAIHALAVACRALNPALPTKVNSFSTLFLKAATFPPGNALLRSAMGHFQMAADWLNDAGYNENLGRTAAAKKMLRHAVAVLGAAPLPPVNH